MSDAGHRTLQQNLKSISCSKGQIVHNDGDGSFGMIYVEEGLLSVSLLSEDGREVTLLRLRKGSVCFLTAVNTIQGIDFEVTMEAETDTSLLCLSESCLSLLMKTHAAFAEFVHRSVAKNFSDTVETLQSILFRTFDERLATFLYEETQITRSNTLYVTHEQIARHIGSAREVVTRALKRFTKDGIVTLSRGSITVINKETLRRIAK